MQTARLQFLLAAALALAAPLGAQAADLVVWWEKGFYPEEDEAVSGDHRRVRAGERQAGRARPCPNNMSCPAKAAAALAAGQPPDFLYRQPR